MLKKKTGNDSQAGNKENYHNCCTGGLIEAAKHGGIKGIVAGTSEKKRNVLDECQEIDF